MYLRTMSSSSFSLALALLTSAVILIGCAILGILCLAEELNGSTQLVVRLFLVWKTFINEIIFDTSLKF